jgi:hypothetical protein
MLTQVGLRQFHSLGIDSYTQVLDQFQYKLEVLETLLMMLESTMQHLVHQTLPSVTLYIVGLKLLRKGR